MTTADQRILARFGLTPEGNRSLLDIIRAGIPTRNAIEFLRWASIGLPLDAVIKVAGISRRMLERRSGARLKLAQSDRLARIARVINAAEDAIGTQEQALKWLNLPNLSLTGARPLEILDTDAGAAHVTTVLGRLREGSFA